jgi:hypothetical protein
MPFMYLLLKKNYYIGTLVILAVSIIINVLFSIFSSADWLQSQFYKLPFVSHKKETFKWVFYLVYRLCINRYLLIYPLLFLLVTKRIKYNILLFSGFVGAWYIFCISYKNMNFEPFIFNSNNWQVYEFPGAFYTLLVFIFLFKIYDYIPAIIQKVVCKIGSKSWEIFIFQMIYFSFSGYLNLNKYLNLVVSLFICIVPIYSYQFMKRPLEFKQ